MTDDNTDTTTEGTSDTTTDDAEPDRHTLDVRTDEDKQQDDELDQLLEEYKRQKASDDPVDENLQQLADKHEQRQADTASEATADGDDPPETGETTVRIGEEVPADEADFMDDPDDDAIDAAAPSEEAKAKRRAERAASERNADADENDASDAPAPSDATTVSDLADEYDIDSDARNDVADDAIEQGAEPDVDAAELGPTSASEVASYEDVADEGVLPEVEPDADFDFEDQDPGTVSDRPDPRTVALPTKGDEPLYVKLGSPDDDACINIVEQMQQAPGLEERMAVVVANVVEKPTWVPDEMGEWAFGVRMSLFGECTRQLGLDDLQDFR